MSWCADTKIKHNKIDGPSNNLLYLHIEVAFVDVLVDRERDLCGHGHEGVGQDEGDGLGRVQSVASVVVGRATQVQR
jgi:hypothetical protein